MTHACRLLARREHSVGELRRKLETKWPGTVVDSAIDRLLEEGLLSDQRFATAFARGRVARFQGPRKIRAELSARGVSEADVEAALEDAGCCWTDLACQWLGRQGVDAPDYDIRARYYRRLVNRGFTHDQAMNALGARQQGSEGV